MTPTEINALIAKKVMGWTLEKGDSGQSWWCHPVGKPEHPQFGYDPYHNTDQAIEAVDHFFKQRGCCAEVYWYTTNKTFGVFDGKGERICDGEGATLSAAICNALVEAVKEIENETQVSKEDEGCN